MHVLRACRDAGPKFAPLALTLIRRMQDRGPPLDHRSVNMAVAICMSVGEVSFAKELLSGVAEPKGLPNSGRSGNTRNSSQQTSASNVARSNPSSSIAAQLAAAQDAILAESETDATVESE